MNIFGGKTLQPWLLTDHRSHVWVIFEKTFGLLHFYNCAKTYRLYPINQTQWQIIVRLATIKFPYPQRCKFLSPMKLRAFLHGFYDCLIEISSSRLSKYVTDTPNIRVKTLYSKSCGKTGSDNHNFFMRCEKKS